MELLLESLLLKLNLLLLQIYLLLHYAGEAVLVTIANLVSTDESCLCDLVAQEELFL